MPTLKKRVAKKATRKKTEQKPQQKAEPAKYRIPDIPSPFDGITPAQYPGTLHEATPEVVITLTAAQFRYVWEMLEGRAHLDHQRYSGPLNHIALVARDAVIAFRRSYAHAQGINTNPVARKMKRKK